MVFYRCRRPGSLKIGAVTDAHSSCVLPVDGRRRAFPLDGERLDRGETLWNAFNFHLLWVSVRS
jgi:hypothetical protein